MSQKEPRPFDKCNFWSGCELEPEHWYIFDGRYHTHLNEFKADGDLWIVPRCRLHMIHDHERDNYQKIVYDSNDLESAINELNTRRNVRKAQELVEK